MDKYKKIKKIGSGSSAEVYMRVHREMGEIVAIKSVTFHELDKDIRGLISREVYLLKMVEHRHIVRLLDVLNRDDGVDLVFEYLNLDLEKFLQIHDACFVHAHSFLHQILEGVQTIPYKAPELLLGLPYYSSPVDIWSVGCVFAEMVNQQTLFAGSHDFEVLQDIVRILGKPDIGTWAGPALNSCYFSKLPDCIPKNLAEVVHRLEPAGVDLVSKMLCINPCRRITAESALEHPYFHDIHNST
ncbi:Cyclin-dependent kinase [Bertholletia excelsa]